MARAACIPELIARMAISGPVAASPPANTPGRRVALSSFTSSRPRGLLICALSSSPRKSISTRWPVARMMQSESITCTSSLSYCGLKRPSASRTDRHLLVFMPRTLPFSSRITSSRPRPLINSTPSSSTRAISSGLAGISSRFSRHTRRTFSTPRRLETSATSMATLPPPQTSTSLPTCPLRYLLTSTRKFRPNCVISSPLRPSTGCFHAPVAM